MALQGHLWIAVNVFVFVVIFSSVTAKIKFRDDIYEPRVVSLSDGEKLEKELNRIRRESSKNNRGKMGVSDSHVEVHVNTFKNKNHKQAVVHWSGSDSNAIFLLTREVIDGVVNSSSLYRSLNYGVTFDEITPQNSVISSFFVDPNNYTKLIFADRKNRAVYVTDDEGKTLSGPHRTQFNPQRLVFNPILENVLLGYSYTQEQLFVSRDLGKTWKKLQDGADSRFF
ncbi:sortilin-like, partial [Lingula anatina]|uniref:Sortilin-like n=1 Tax=Lingula anatina TaxID=7574 RepID=A0A1S3IY36_LINAN